MMLTSHGESAAISAAPLDGDRDQLLADVAAAPRAERPLHLQRPDGEEVDRPAPRAPARRPARAVGVVAALRRAEDLGRIDADAAEERTQRGAAVEEEVARLLEAAPAV